MVAARRILTADDIGVLRTELVELAYELERRSRFDAADVALALEARLRELAEVDPTMGATLAALPSRFP